jgi:hypothetical protein
MKLIVLITVVESLALMLWLAYSYHKRRPSTSFAVVGERSGSVHQPQLNPSLLLRDSGHWSFINDWELQPRYDDRPPLNGFVAPRSEAAPSVRRAFARQCHQLMYKKWSKDRHDERVDAHKSLDQEAE